MNLAEQRRALINVTEAQRTAAGALANGATLSKAAEAAQVTRDQVSLWAAHHPGFRALFERERAANEIERAPHARQLPKVLTASELLDAEINAAAHKLGLPPFDTFDGRSERAEAIVIARLTDALDSGTEAL